MASLATIELAWITATISGLSPMLLLRALILVNLDTLVRREIGKLATSRPKSCGSSQDPSTRCTRTPLSLRTSAIMPITMPGPATSTTPPPIVTALPTCDSYLPTSSLEEWASMLLCLTVPMIGALGWNGLSKSPWHHWTPATEEGSLPSKAYLSLSL